MEINVKMEEFQDVKMVIVNVIVKMVGVETVA